MITRKSTRTAITLAVAACLAGASAWAGTNPGPDGNAKAEDLGIVTGLAVGAAAAWAAACRSSFRIWMAMATSTS